MKNQTCSTCRYREHEDIDDGYVCVCDKSVHCADWVEEDMACPYWEGRKNVHRTD